MPSVAQDRQHAPAASFGHRRQDSSSRAELARSVSNASSSNRSQPSTAHRRNRAQPDNACAQRGPAPVRDTSAASNVDAQASTSAAAASSDTSGASRNRKSFNAVWSRSASAKRPSASRAPATDSTSRPPRSVAALLNMLLMAPSVTCRRHASSECAAARARPSKAEDGFGAGRSSAASCWPVRVQCVGTTPPWPPPRPAARSSSFSSGVAPSFERL
mmetsp:Transcript_17093/g.44916  ORF Transcript_17093/g.44916 Transcript_17093/m.44916 type:complete len:217 (-) Transcript_17093:536-1186(-)